MKAINSDLGMRKALLGHFRMRAPTYRKLRVWYLQQDVANPSKFKLSVGRIKAFIYQNPREVPMLFFGETVHS